MIRKWMMLFDLCNTRPGRSRRRQAASKERAMPDFGGGMERPELAGKMQQPGTEAFRLDRPVSEALADERATECATVFGSLVTSDDDIVGLVAYTIFKQHENDWLVAFKERKGRAPDGAESSAFIIGESTARRLASYRQLAEATLAGNGPKAPAGSSTTTFVQRSYAAAARYAPRSSPAQPGRRA
jgi:hypothetical protein